MSYRDRGGFNNSGPYFGGRDSDPGGFRNDRGGSPPVEVIRRTVIDEDTDVTPLGLRPGPPLPSSRGRGGRGRGDSFRGGRGGGGFQSGFGRDHGYGQYDQQGGPRPGPPAPGRGRGGNYEPLGRVARPWGSRGGGFGGRPPADGPGPQPLMSFRRNQDTDHHEGPPDSFQRRMPPDEPPKTTWELQRGWGTGTTDSDGPSPLSESHQRQEPPQSDTQPLFQTQPKQPMTRPRGPPPPPLIGTASRNQATGAGVDPTMMNTNPWNNFGPSQGSQGGPYRPARPSTVHNSRHTQLGRNQEKDHWAAAAWPNSHQSASGGNKVVAAPNDNTQVTDDSGLSSNHDSQRSSASLPQKPYLNRKERTNTDFLEKTLQKIERQRKSTDNQDDTQDSPPAQKKPPVTPQQKTTGNQHRVQRVPPSPPAWAKAALKPKETLEPVVDLTESDDDGETKEAKFIEMSTKLELQVSSRPRWRNTAQGVKLYGFHIQFKHDGVDHTIEGKYVPNVNEAREDAYILAYQRLKSLIKEEPKEDSKAPELEVVEIVQETVTSEREVEELVVQEEPKKQSQPLLPTPIQTTFVPNPLAAKAVQKSANAEDTVKRTPLFAMHRQAPPPPPQISQAPVSDVEFEAYSEPPRIIQPEHVADGSVEVFSWGQKRGYSSMEDPEAPFEDLFKKYMDKLHMRCWLNPKKRIERGVRVLAYEIKIESFDEQFNTQYIGGVFINDKYAKESAFEIACKGLEEIFPDIVKAGQTPDPTSPAGREFNELRCKLRLEYNCFPEIRIEHDGSKSYCYSIDISRAGEKEVVDGIYQTDERKAKEKAFEFAVTRIRYRYAAELERCKQPIRKPEPVPLATSSPKTPIYYVDSDEMEADKLLVPPASTSRDRSPSLALVSPMPKKLTSFIPTPSCYNPPKKVNRPQAKTLLQAPPPPPPPPPPSVPEPFQPFNQERRPPPQPVQEPFQPFTHERRPPPTPLMQSDAYRHDGNQYLAGAIPGDANRATYEYRFKEAARFHNLRYNSRVIPRYEGPYQIFVGEISYHSESGRFSPGFITGDSFRDQNQAMEDVYRLGFQRIDHKYQALISRVGTQTSYQQPPLPPLPPPPPPQQQPHPSYMAGSSYSYPGSYGPSHPQDFGSYYQR